MNPLEQFQVLDDVPIGICVIDHDYSVVFWNDCIASWTKKDKSEIIGKHLGDIFDHFKLKQYTSRIDPILSGGPPSIFSSQLHGQLFPSILPNGKFRILQTTVTHVPKPDSDQFYALFAVKDFTDLSNRIMEYRNMQKKAESELEHRKAVEAELRTANEEIIEQQKEAIEEERLKVLLQMAGATAHELNQPLMILLGNIELLEMCKDDPEKFKAHISNINEAGKRISSIIKKIQRVKSVIKKPYTQGRQIIDIHQKEKVLYIEDDPAVFNLITMMLDETKYSDIHHAATLGEARSMMYDHHIDLILLDYLLPDGDAFDMLGFLNKEDFKTPVIILTGQGDEAVATKLLRKGAADYLPKRGLERESLLESIEFVMDKHYLSRDRDRAMMIMGDMSSRDELTGLYNRRYFDQALSREISGAHRYEKKLALCMIDIDHFKRINDTFGHTVGDEVLASIADIITSALRQYDIPCRYGGEEFSIILPDTDRTGAAAVCERIRQEVAAFTFTPNNKEFQVTLSAGVAFMESSGLSPEDHSALLIRQADHALYQAKNTGRNRVSFAV
ncbi:MAG: diguanylate cyclase [Desulfobacteraceae bacterium]|nr:MAG: diguanylate cyclase [Desulfobacteraceae bacterium]